MFGFYQNGLAMEKCVLCGADTILLVNGVPTCLQCDTKSEAEESYPVIDLVAKAQSQAARNRRRLT